MNPDSTHHVLGRQVAYPDRYSPDILVRVDRAGNRMAHHIDEVHLPFTGLDLWNAYEVSALTDAGAPVNFIMRLLYPCESRYIVESKSLKLYLYSFRNTNTFHEESVNTILDAVVKTCSPRRAEVIGRFRPRGGIAINVKATYGDKIDE